jgi:hypothetical protein
MTNCAPPPSAPRGIVRAGGVSLIVGATAFVGVFSYLAARFNYPEVLDGRAADVLPALLQTGGIGRAVWAIYALLPLIWVPAAVGAFSALRHSGEGRMRLAVALAVISSIAMMLGLMRWPSSHWELARAWAADPGIRPAVEVIFNAANRYLGNYIGEFLGELCMSGFFLLTASVMANRDSGYSRVLAWLGICTAAAGLLGMFRNVSGLAAPVAEANNYLLPIWMVALGVALIRNPKRRIAAKSPVPVAA